MITNFEIIENYALNVYGRHIDLHNNFDFVEYKYDVIEQKLTLYWVKTNGNWVKEEEFKAIELVHKRVSYLAMNTETLSAIQDNTLSSITFFSSNDRHINDCITPQSKPEIDDDIIYLFENGQFIRVNCEEVELLGF